MHNSACGSVGTSIIGGCYNFTNYTKNSAIIGGVCNYIVSYDDSSARSSIIGGCCNGVYGSVYSSSIIGGYCNYISFYSNYSSIVGGLYNRIECGTCNSTILGGCNNCLHCSTNSIIIGGSDLCISNVCNTIFLNETTNLRQTSELVYTSAINSSPFTIDFRDGGIKYINSLSTDFDINFTNVPEIANTTITYTLILSQSSNAYIINDLTINTNPYNIKWSGVSNLPEIQTRLIY